MMKIRIVLVALLTLVASSSPVDAGPASPLIKMKDFEFRPFKMVANETATNVQWQNKGKRTHTATSDLTGYFDTGNVASGALSPSPFLWSAGTFRYRCTIHPRMKGKFAIPMSGPTTGTTGVPFTVFWAEESKGVLDGYNADIQVKEPGKRKFKDEFLDQVDLEAGAEYTPEVPGKYVFRARLQHNTEQDASGYSPKLKVVVSD